MSAKNQATLPVDALAEAGLRAGDELKVEAAGRGRLMLTRSEDPIERYAGALPGVWEAGHLAKLRDEWRR